MPVRIEKDGWAVTGDSPQDLAMGIAAVQEALNGGTSRPKPATPVPPPSPPANSAGKREKRQKVAKDERVRPTEAEMRETALAFLRAIQAAPEGIYGNDLRLALGLTDPKALGGSMASINRAISAAGFDPEPDAYARGRNINGRIWTPGDKIGKVIAAMNSKD